MERKGRKPSVKERIQYGICLNDGCPKAKSKEIQQLPLRKEFVCSECGKPLRECPPPKSSSKPGLIVSVAVGIVALCVGGYFLFLGRDKEESEGNKNLSLQKETPVDSVLVTPEELILTVGETGKLEARVYPSNATDNTIKWSTPDGDIVKVSQEGVVEALKPGRAIVIASAGDMGRHCTLEVKEKNKPASNKYSLGWGLYEGPKQGGKPHGIGGEIVVTQSFSIDLKKMTGEKLSLRRGDTIVNTKFKEGRLISGVVHYADGRQESFNIGS